MAEGDVVAAVGDGAGDVAHAVGGATGDGEEVTASELVRATAVVVQTAVGQSAAPATTWQPCAGRKCWC